ncbi:hypothetical protein KCU93_g8178, partial [Aureobasidium melanogenum]
MMPEDLPYHSKKHVKDDAFGPAFFPSQKRVKHNEDQPQGIAKHHAPLADFAETTTRPLSPDGGVAIDEEALVKFRSHIVPSCDDDPSDDFSHDGSHNDNQPGEDRPEQNKSLSLSSHAKDQTAALPYASPLPVFNHQRGSYVIISGSSMPTYQPFRGLQSAQPLDSMTLNPRVGMAVEGGKLYLAQTLHHYYRKHTHCPHHGPEDGRPGHHRAARKVHETGKVYRVWFCASQPREEGHRIDNTDYIELAIAQLDRVLFDRILHEMIRQLRSRNCQPVARHHSPQPDDFDYHALLQYVDWQRVDKTVFKEILLD